MLTAKELVAAIRMDQAVGRHVGPPTPRSPRDDERPAHSWPKSSEPEAAPEPKPEEK